MRLRKRPQGRTPTRLASTSWTVFVDRNRAAADESQRWDGTSLVGLHRWLLEVKPQPLDTVTLVRNGKAIYYGTWHDLAGDPTLW